MAETPQRDTPDAGEQAATIGEPEPRAFSRRIDCTLAPEEGRPDAVRAPRGAGGKRVEVGRGRRRDGMS